MGSGITFAEVRAVVSFLKKYEGGYVEKNYIDGKNVSFKLRKSGINSTYIHFVDGDFIFLSNENMIGGKKNVVPVENIQIQRIKQVGTDRIIMIEGQRSIIIEMMGGGNLIVTESGNIIFSTKQVRRSGKILEKGDTYVLPEIIDLESPYFPIEDKIRESKADPVRTLAARVGLSKYSEEILCSLNRDIKDNTDLLKNIDDLKERIKELIRESETGNIYIYGNQFFVWKSKCIDRTPEIRKVEEGLKELYELTQNNVESKGASIRRDVTKMQEEMEKLKRYGEIVMSNLNEIDHFLSQVRNNKADQAIIDYDKGIAIFRKDDIEIPLKFSFSAGENANEFFNSAKKIREKLSRVSIEKEEKSVSKKRKLLHTIFKNYRWFVTSEGNLVIAGKDAETNDSVVKKYLDERDLYLHADIHGAPSVVLKNNHGIGDSSIQEAAQFAWCMSKAWNAKFGNGAVFYVTRSQVSKTPESGEYLARGAWVIRGKKNFITHLELELAIGFQRYENRDYIVSAPPSAIKGRKVIIVPGEDKENLTNKISEFFGIEKEFIYPILPPGGSEIKEMVNQSSDLPRESQDYNDDGES